MKYNIIREGNEAISYNIIFYEKIKRIKECI